MHLLFIRGFSVASLAFAIFFSAIFANGQEASARKPLMLVTWFGTGAIALPADQDWKPELLTVYDEGRRPVAQFAKGDTGLTASFIVFENQSGTSTAQGCRQDAIDPIAKNEGKRLSKRTDGELKSSTGESLATASYLIDLTLGSEHHSQRNTFAFAGNSKTCAEMHISSVRESPSDESAMTALVSDFHPDLSYQPESLDYFRLASILFKKSPGMAAPYYKSSLDTLPRDANAIDTRRVVTDQLVMSLGMSGDIKNSRAVAENAIAADPAYPMNYYNLACADAEKGDASGAKLHLQQAFDQRANVIKGESMPDPTKDDSILKLQKNKTFWTFVEALPKN